jgi:hypothetical protein
MAGDGVSLQTNIAQLGNVAKSQARSQQVGATGPGHAEKTPADDVQPLQKVQETEKAEQQGVDPEQKRDQDKRQRRRRQRQATKGDEVAEQNDEEQDEAAPGLGGLIDTMA